MWGLTHLNSGKCGLQIWDWDRAGVGLNKSRVRVGCYFGIINELKKTNVRVKSYKKNVGGRFGIILQEGLSRPEVSQRWLFSLVFKDVGEFLHFGLQMI